VSRVDAVLDLLNSSRAQGYLCVAAVNGPRTNGRIYRLLCALQVCESSHVWPRGVDLESILEMTVMSEGGDGDMRNGDMM
jgi:hypothetical protein